MHPPGTMIIETLYSASPHGFWETELRSRACVEDALALESSPQPRPSFMEENRTPSITFGRTLSGGLGFPSVSVEMGKGGGGRKRMCLSVE